MSSALRLLALLVGLTLVVTFPQVSHLRTGVHDFGDPLLNAWALAWTPHAVVTGAAPLDANIFYPERSTLALSETLIFPALLGAPFRAAGANAILLHNLTLLSGYVFSGLTMFLLVTSLTRDRRAGTLAAVAFALCPLRTEYYPRVQQQLTYLMPLALYFVHRIFEGETRIRAFVLLGLTCGALFYSCVYYWVFFATVLPVVLLVYLLTRRRGNWRMAGGLALAAIVTAALVAPAAPAYLHNRRLVGERQIDEVVRGSAELRDFRRPTADNLLYGNRNRVGPNERNLFTGYVVPIVAAAAIVSPLGEWLPYGAAFIASVDLSLGLNGRSYSWLYAHVVAYRALRVPARFAVLANMFLAILAGIGCSRVTARLSSDWQRNLLLVGLAGGVVLESLNRPLELRDMPTRVPAVYLWLHDNANGPVVEYPVDGLEGRIGPQDATYMYYSTTHWRWLLNGYSGFVPPSYVELRERLRDFPDRSSIDYLRERGARYLLVHERYYLRGGFEPDVESLRHADGLHQTAAFTDPVLGRTFVFELAP
ncbi:MAG TPA: DUF6044 family protein [Vicinamibacterales bacterium]|nr:DUF6044 family protein [Vicinamibacterales bacterium]